MKNMDLEKDLIARAVAGEQEALAEVLNGVQDMVFGLSLRMLGLVPDAEDATQEILIKVMTRLSTFRQESSLSTWVFRIAVNHLRDVHKSRFDERPLSFEHTARTSPGAGSRMWGTSAAAWTAGYWSRN